MPRFAFGRTTSFLGARSAGSAIGRFPLPGLVRNPRFVLANAFSTLAPRFAVPSGPFCPCVTPHVDNLQAVVRQITIAIHVQFYRSGKGFSNINPPVFPHLLPSRRNPPYLLRRPLPAPNILCFTRFDLFSALPFLHIFSILQHRTTFCVTCAASPEMQHRA